MTQDKKPPVWFWALGIFALIWNGLGIGAYANDIMMTAEKLAGMTELEQNLFVNRPFWASAAFAVAVIGGFMGSIMLLLRRRIAVRLFLMSLIAVLIQFASYFILDGYADYFSQNGWSMPISIPILAVAFLIFARWAEKSGFLR